MSDVLAGVLLVFVVAFLFIYDETLGNFDEHVINKCIEDTITIHISWWGNTYSCDLKMDQVEDM